MRNLFLIGGLPGSGKTTRAMAIRSFAESTGLTFCHAEADHFFMKSGVYRFNPWELGQAHSECQIKAARAMQAGVSYVVVSNTFSQKWESQLYLMLADVFGYSVEVIDLYDVGYTDKELADRNIHGCPAAKIAEMRGRWEK